LEILPYLWFVMDSLKIIKEPLREDFAHYEKFMREALQSSSGYVDNIMEYIISNRGKGIRPVLVFLSAGIHSGGRGVGSRAYLAAMLVEMIHTASLVHDDVVDDSQVRHGKPSVNSKWNSRVSILTGDYILARSFSAGMNSAQYDIVAHITSLVSALAEGELIQIDVNERRAMSRQSYLDIIYKKTALLLGASCGSGAMASGASPDEIARANSLGINLGMAFQIKDDILDYSPQEQTGKPFCADLQEKKITLPLLSILERSDASARKLIMDRLERIDSEPENISLIRDTFIAEGGIASASEVMHQYLDKARAIVASYPASPYRTSMEKLCDYIGVRNN
jgi:octaprenyl-diphosphate synthase